MNIIRKYSVVHGSGATVLRQALELNTCTAALDTLSATYCRIDEYSFEMLLCLLFEIGFSFVFNIV